ncbi:hypothetical protein NZK32_09750 [Cyanobium sp. FGCU-52]|nr:hypothetical protein [Cyanobium sp. FGCU52]
MTSASDSPAPDRLDAAARKAVLAASAPWLAALLNLVPGLGSGYIYQRRWRAYWITSAVATSWFVLGAVLGSGGEAGTAPRDQLIGLAGLLLLAAVTMTEAFLAGRKARMD